MDDQHLNDDGEGEEGVGNVPIHQPLLAIESLEDYVNRFGLPHANGGKVKHRLTSSFCFYTIMHLFHVPFLIDHKSQNAVNIR